MTMNNDPRIDEARELLLILAGNDEALLDRVIAADKDKYGTISITRVVAMLTDATRVDKDAEIARLRIAERMNVETIVALQADRDKYKNAVTLHNRECDDRCADAASCGYRQYFINNGRRCPTCPVGEKISI